MGKETDTLSKWDDFNDSEYLSPMRVRGEDHEFVVVDIEEYVDRDKTTDEVVKRSVILHLESDEGKLKRKFRLNKTNGRYLEEQGMQSPREVVGCTLRFEMVKVRNPSTGKNVDSLSINSVTRP